VDDESCLGFLWGILYHQTRVLRHIITSNGKWSVFHTCSSSFITVIYFLSVAFLCCTCAPTHFPTYAGQRHTYSSTAGDRERGKMSRSANDPFSSLGPFLWGRVVCNSMCTPLIITHTVYSSSQVHKGGQGAHLFIDIAHI